MLSTEEGFYARAYVQCTEPDRVGGELRPEDVLVEGHAPVTVASSCRGIRLWQSPGALALQLAPSINQRAPYRAPMIGIVRGFGVPPILFIT